VGGAGGVCTCFIGKSDLVVSQNTFTQSLIHSYGHDLTRELQLIGFNTDRAAVQLGVSLSWGAAAQDREKWRKLAARLPLAPVTVETKPISEQARTERTQSEHAQPAPDPAATTWSQRLRSRG
jgi:hypothetical protein